MTSHKPLGEIATVVMGQSPPGETYNTAGEGLPFFQGKAEFREESPFVMKWCSAPSRVAEAGDVLLSVRAPVGPTNIASERCCIGRGLAAIRAKRGLATTRYIRYFFRRFEDEIATKGVGSTFTAINRRDIERLPVPFIPLTEQNRIVKLLDAAQELRRLRAEADGRTADLIPAIFYEMFGDPATNPKRWPVSKTGDLLTICEYGTSQKADENGQGVPVLRMNNVTYDGRLDLHELKHVILADRELDKQRLAAGDVLFNRTNSRDLVGKTSCWDARFEAVAASYFIRLRFDPDKEHHQHFTTFMNLPLMKSRLEKMARGAVGQANINAKELRGIALPVPPISLQHQFAARVTEVRALEAQQAASRQRLDDLFQSLLHRAFRGEL